MKKLFFAVFAALALAACNKELGPEYSVAPVVTSVTHMPIAPTSDDKITVRAQVESQYGLGYVWITYWYGDDEVNAVSTKPYYGKGESETKLAFSGTIPKLKAGDVKFVVVAQSPFGVFGASAVNELTVSPGTGPEYTTKPEFGQVTIDPVAPREDQNAIIMSTITCKYGIDRVWVTYWLNDDQTKAVDLKPAMGGGEAQTSLSFVDRIPMQAAGTKVSFRLTAKSAYGVVATTEVYDYTVIAK